MSSTGSHGTAPGASPNWKVTFPEIEVHSPKDQQPPVLPGAEPDNLSISSRGTSSTVGYR